MSTWIPASAWTRKGPQSVSAKIRQRKSTKQKVARKGAIVQTVAVKIRKQGAESGTTQADWPKAVKPRKNP